MNNITHINNQIATKQLVKELENSSNPIILRLTSIVNGREVAVTKQFNPYILKSFTTEDRSKSFNDKEGNFSVSKEKLAESGFRYMGNFSKPDRVQCVFCNGVLSGFEESDIVDEEHKRHFPECPLIKGEVYNQLSLLPESNPSPVDSKQHQSGIIDAFSGKINFTKNDKPKYSVEAKAIPKSIDMKSIELPSEVQKEEHSARISLKEINILSDEAKDIRHFFKKNRPYIVNELTHSQVLQYSDQILASNDGLPLSSAKPLTENMYSEIVDSLQHGPVPGARNLLDKCGTRPSLVGLYLMAIMHRMNAVDPSKLESKYPEWIKPYSDQLPK